MEHIHSGGCDTVVRIQPECALSEKKRLTQYDTASRSPDNIESFIKHRKNYTG